MDRADCQPERSGDIAQKSGQVLVPRRSNGRIRSDMADTKPGSDVPRSALPGPDTVTADWVWRPQMKFLLTKRGRRW